MRTHRTQRPSSRARSLGVARTVGRAALAALLAACSANDGPSEAPSTPTTTTPAQPPAVGTGVNASTGGAGNAATGPVGAPQPGPTTGASNPGAPPSAPGAPGIFGVPGMAGGPDAASASGMPDTAAPPPAAPLPGPTGNPMGTDVVILDGGEAMPAMTDAGAPEPPAQTGTCLKGSGDFVDDGPYAVKTKVVTVGSKGQYTIYYPDPLEQDCPHPIVAWGNGTFITGGTAYAHFHRHAATWGIVTISSHDSNVGDGTFQTAAIDYLLEQNKDSGSEFFGKLSSRAGVSGHSQGGAGSDRAAAMHDNVEAINNVQGSFGTPPDSDAALLCLTGTSDIQPTGCPQAVKAAKVPALCASWDGADHVGTTLLEGEGIEQYLRLNAAWFRCFLADDVEACALFMGGADCPVCKEPGWAEIFANNY